MEIKCLKYEDGSCRFYAFVTVKEKGTVRRTGERFKVHQESPDFKRAKSAYKDMNISVTEAELKAAYDAA